MNSSFYVVFIVSVLFAYFICRVEKHVVEYSPYFHNLNSELKFCTKYKYSDGLVIIDLKILEENIRKITSYVDDPSNIRLVTKSLPSIDLLKFLMDRVGTKKLMVFHFSFLKELISKFGTSVDYLLGLPFSPYTLHKFFVEFERNKDFSNLRTIQWLVDSEELIEGYIEVAKEFSVKLRISLEIDVGMHRGGIEIQNMKQILKKISNNQKYLQLSGFMGYDGYVKGHPFRKLFSGAYDWEIENILKKYEGFINLLEPSWFSTSLTNLVFNGAGSTTLSLYKDSRERRRRRKKKILNDFSIGSAFLRPTHFDVPLLEDAIKPSVFIAGRVIKIMKYRNPVPYWLGEYIWKIYRFFDSNKKQTFYTTVLQLPGLSQSSIEPKGIIGNSLIESNRNINLFPTQKIFHCSENCQIEIDDLVFARPSESDLISVFGNIVVFNKSCNGTINWKTFQYGL